MKKDINFLIEKPIAHRGLWSEDVAENSLIAFSRAIDAGYPIELDVQLTADGRPVVIHDWTLERMTGASGYVAKTKYSEIKNLTLGNSKQKILLLEDVLNLVDGQVGLIIELKSKSYFDYQICTEVYKLLKNYSGKYAVSSFNPLLVRWFRNNAPQVVRGQNFTDFKNKNALVAFFKRVFLYISWAISVNEPDFFACRASMIPDSFPIRIARREDKLIIVYTVTDEVEYDRIKAIVDNEFFDNKPYKRYE